MQGLGKGYISSGSMAAHRANRGGDVMGRPWTGQEINTLVSMWPNASTSQIATGLHRSYGCVRSKAIRLREMGLLEAKKARRPSSIKPSLTDFDKVKMDYCRKHNMTTAQLCARLQSDD